VRTNLRRLLILTGVAMLVVLAGASAVATAQEYPPVEPTQHSLTTPGTVVVGAEIAISGDECGANQPVAISVNGAPVTTVTSDANGHFTATLPAINSPGVYTVTASNGFCSLSGTVQVDPASATGASLAFTGSSGVGPTAWIAAGLIALGAVLIVVARRRNASTRSGS
jgi:hypothetical protein